MKIVPYRRYDLYDELTRPFDMMRSMLGRKVFPNLSAEAEWLADDFTLAVDIVEHDDEFIVKTAIPGIKEEDVEIGFTNGMLMIKAESKDEFDKEDENYHVHELHWGKFSRSVRLPSEVNVDKAEATVTNGILEVKLPKTKPSPVHRIAVKTKELLGKK
jgi:HSP20 family protein